MMACSKCPRDFNRRQQKTEGNLNLILNGFAQFSILSVASVASYSNSPLPHVRPHFRRSRSLSYNRRQAILSPTLNEAQPTETTPHASAKASR